ncbi:ferredoxin-NADP reductase [Pseudonocardia hierapolitana]|uniref:Ferredoxin-NADP reductase n=1 Tax=Pseudonocardia hierapolitana TaxID=1128676 RepID=A0A561SXB2_9PSEU|nr:PDR/VanB family oxidoreductase [Pseudonocardia hierapolitana]TWF79508.1 ferredoxin-NADP reductase [Pseudonocardia hierapolitana]
MADPFEGEVVVVSRRAESDGVVSLELGLPSGDPVPSWEPGAHIDLVLPGGLTRQYSLCGPVENDKSWRVAVLREPDGRGGSRWVHDHAHEGCTLTARGPRNHFPLLGSPRYLFIAGGIGITPLLPMISQVHASGAGWELHYGGRERASMAFLDELEGYGDHVTIRPEDQLGMLDLATVLAGPDRSTLVYCCGPAGLIDAVEERCRTWPPGALHVERFTNVITPSGDDAEFEVELRGSGVTVTVPAHLSILEAVENAGVPVLSSCTEGTCGTCETTVLEGEVDHRDVVLTDEERDAGETMMICVSRARCGRLVLDL